MTNAAWENSVLAYNHPATCQVWYSGFADHSYIRGMSLAELEEHPNSLVNRFVLFSSVIEDCVCLFLDLQRDILCKSNVFDYICALDAISAQSYSVFLRLFIKRTSQATKWLQQLFATLLAVVFVSSGQPMEKIATQHCIASCSLSAASSKIWLFRFLEIRHQTIRPPSLTLPMLR